MSFREDDQIERPQAGDERREERSVDPEIRERELEELESGQRADTTPGTGDEEIGDTDIPGPESETSE
jgi:hypothetical protein